MLLRSWELASWSGLLEWSSSWPLSWSVSSGSSTSLHSEEQQKTAHTWLAHGYLKPPKAPLQLYLSLNPLRSAQPTELEDLGVPLQPCPWNS